MNFTPEEQDKLKTMLTFLIKRKHVESGGHCGFTPRELEPILDDMVDEGLLVKRNTIHNYQYFINS